MPVQDLRDWIKKMEAINGVKKIHGATWEEEIGVITDLYQRHPGAPALLFDNIPGYPKGSRVLTNSLAAISRIAAALEMPAHSSKLEVVDKWRRQLKDFKPIKPKFVKTGPVLENVQTGEKIDVFKFPTPKWHELDGGRYIGTGCMVITRDPDTGWVNSGTYQKSFGAYDFARQARPDHAGTILGQRKSLPGCHRCRPGSVAVHGIGHGNPLRC